MKSVIYDQVSYSWMLQMIRHCNSFLMTTNPHACSSPLDTFQPMGERIAILFQFLAWQRADTNTGISEPCPPQNIANGREKTDDLEDGDQRYGKGIK